MRRVFLVLIGLVLLGGQIYLSARIFLHKDDTPGKASVDKPKKKKPAKNRQLAKNPLLAIVIDDIGYNEAYVRQLLDISPSLTYSIIPDLPYSARAAKLVQASGGEIMVHLPMEPKGGNQYPGENPLLLSMTDDEIGRVALQRIQSVPGARGVNNHTGSLFTENERGMRIVLSLIKEKGLYFVDSRTTPDTVAFRVAGEMGVRVYMNDRFLDGENDELKIWDKWNNLIEIALTDGRALGIGHPHEATIKILREEVPKLSRRGIKLVPVSVLLERK